jgi:hypothetical protein
MQEKEKKAKPARIMTDAQGQSVPAEYVKPYDRERDRVARRILKRFQDEHDRLARLKADTLADISRLQAYGRDAGEALGGVKGNVQFSSFDALVRVRLDARTMVDFDDRFRQAQELIFAYVDELTGATDQADVATIIKAAFRPSASGMLARSKIVGLLRLNIRHEMWVRAMDLLRESQLVKSGKSYLYVETRPSLEGDWEAVPLDIAAIDPAASDKEDSARPSDAQPAQ